MAVDPHFMRMKQINSRYVDGHDDYPEDILRSFSSGNSPRDIEHRDRRGDRRYDRPRRDRDRERDRDYRDRDRDRYDRASPRDRSRDYPDRNNGYTALTAASELVQESTDPKRPNVRHRAMSDEDEFDCDKWRELATCGELDVYTCLGLSDVTTWTVDTQKLLFKILAATVMQIVVPSMMLYLEIMKLESVHNAQAMSFTEIARDLKPARSGIAFRGIGFTMILYSLYTMHKNAVDECRASAMHFCIQEGVKSGIWLPLAVGEFVNICVSVLLILAMYFIFINITDGAELILNAVAVNFLGDVDGEFVDRDAFKDAVENFDKLMEKYKGKPRATRTCIGKLLENFLQLLLVMFLLLGVTLSLVFLVSPDRDGQSWYEGY